MAWSQATPRYAAGVAPVTGSTSRKAPVPASWYSAGLRNPNGPCPCSASATMPAISGAARLVPPTDCSA